MRTCPKGGSSTGFEVNFHLPGLTTVMFAFQYFIGFNQFRVIVILRKSSGSQKIGMKFETIFSGLHDGEYDIPLATRPGAAGRNHFSD